MNTFDLQEVDNQYIFIERLNSFFKTEKEIVSVYLFGSIVSGKIHKQSDLDIGLIFDKSLSKSKRLEKVIYYCGYLDHGIQIDIVDMNSADFPILYSIFNEGQLIVENDHDSRVAFEALKMSQYADLKYYEDLQFRGLIENFRAGITDG